MPRVGRHDNFFQLGGDQLLATRVANRVSERFAIEFPLRTFFTATTTIARLASEIEGAQLQNRRMMELTTRRLDEAELPLGEIEEKLAEIWRAIFGISQIGRNDNFFEPGGNSLTAMVLIREVRYRLGCELSLRELFESLTIAELAAGIEPDMKPKEEERKDLAD